MVSARQALLWILAASCAGGCASSGSRDPWARHFSGEVWGGALGAQFQRPDRVIPEMAIFATIPPSFIYDTDIHEHYEEKPLEDDTTIKAANALQILLPAIPVMIGGMKWAGGDEGENFEVAAETLGGVVAIQQLMARVIVHRERPDHKDTTSFPSGHSSWAFAATTLLVNDMHDPADKNFHAVDAFVYLPAVFNAWQRIAIDHHWTSDVTCGALLGLFWANLVWDVHYPGGDDRPAVYPNGHRHEAVWRPAVDVIDGNLAMGVGVSF